MSEPDIIAWFEAKLSLHPDKARALYHSKYCEISRLNRGILIQDRYYFNGTHVALYRAMYKNKSKHISTREVPI